MIAYLEGVIVSKSPTGIVLSVGGVGFSVGMSHMALAQMPSVGESATVHTYLQVREDELSLYGFVSLEEKALFEKLISVSGVGPKVALAALSSYEPVKLIQFIQAQDVSAIQKIPGVGKKMASRIILELKGSLDIDAQGLFDTAASATSAAFEGAREALLSMGFSSAEADIALQGAPEGAAEAALIQYALKRLGS